MPSPRICPASLQRPTRASRPATLIYRQNWDRNGTVSFSLPMPVARQVLGDRGWQLVSSSAGTYWRAPNGETFWETDEALGFALTAECVDARSARKLGATAGPSLVA